MELVKAGEQKRKANAGSWASNMSLGVEEKLDFSTLQGG